MKKRPLRGETPYRKKQRHGKQERDRIAAEALGGSKQHAWGSKHRTYEEGKMKRKPAAATESR